MKENIMKFLIIFVILAGCLQTPEYNDSVYNGDNEFYSDCVEHQMEECF